MLLPFMLKLSNTKPPYLGKGKIYFNNNFLHEQAIILRVGQRLNVRYAVCGTRSVILPSYWVYSAFKHLQPNIITSPLT